MFSQACVKNSVLGGGGFARHPYPGRQTHPRATHLSGQTPLPPGQTSPQADLPGRHPPWVDPPPIRRLLQRTVRILLECILVYVSLLLRR